MSGAVFQALLASGGSAVKRTFLDHQWSTASGTSHTFATMAFGAAASNRVLLACIENNSSGSITSVTIGGVTATAIISGSLVTMWAATVPSGTTGDVVVTVSSTATKWGCQLYKLEGLSSLAAKSTAGSTATAPTATLNVPVGGAVIAAVMGFGTNNSTTTWTGATEDVDDSDSLLVNYSSASVEVPTGNASLTVTATFSASHSNTIGSFAVFAP